MCYTVMGDYMSEFKELIKSFFKSREYVRDFFVYGFKTRDEFSGWSSRTYDNERRRLESWLSGYVRQDYTKKGKNIYLSIDSNLLDTNPLYQVWKAKSFTDNDIMLHFYILDYLQKSGGQTADEITDGILAEYDVMFDSQMVRRKCNQYVKEGMLKKIKNGKEVLYRLNPPFRELRSAYPGLENAIKLYQLSSPLGMIGKNEWGFYEKQNGILRSKLSTNFYVPLTDLQKSYLKAILMDDKIRLFLSDAEIADINEAFDGVEPLFVPEDFYYYDRFSDKDDYKNPDYRKHFQTITAAFQNHEYLDILYESRFNHRVHHSYLPCRLEYSIKNDRFRLLAVNSHSLRNPRVETLNLSRIKEITPTNQTVRQLPDINKSLQRSYYREPVRIIIKNQRNALERAMLQFANYEKSTRRIDENTYECLIYYNKKAETELLIEVLSFGPMMKVVGNEDFLHLIKERLARQAELLS